MAASQNGGNSWLANCRGNLRDHHHRAVGADSLLGRPHCLCRADYGHRRGGTADVPNRAATYAGGLSESVMRPFSFVTILYGARMELSFRFVRGLDLGAAPFGSEGAVFLWHKLAPLAER